ncbi:MAG: Fur family transcriptional regulator [Cyanobacteria bacterium P01_A01_bin.135]
MNSSHSDGITAELKARGLRVTPQRYAIYASLKSRSDHPTAELLMEDINQHFPTSSQATVYNSLQTLCDVGLVREVLLEHGVARYDANVQPHHHCICRQCGRISDLSWSTFPDLSLAEIDAPFHPEGYEVTVTGLCDRCTD